MRKPRESERGAGKGENATGGREEEEETKKPGDADALYFFVQVVLPGNPRITIYSTSPAPYMLPWHVHIQPLPEKKKDAGNNNNNNDDSENHKVMIVFLFFFLPHV